jgi:hypothetical protein
MFIAPVVDTGDKLLNLSMVWLTPVLYLCQGFSVIAGVVDTGDDNNTGNKLLPVTMTPVNTGVVITGDKFISGDKNKDAMKLGSCQG